MGDELLGRGGFGEVLSGSLNEGEAVRPVALKRLNLSRADAQMFGSALLDEVGIMMSLDHACVLRCLGAVLDPAALDSAHRPLGCCIVTERCLGSLRGSLDQLGGEREPKTGADLVASLLASWTNSLKVASDVARGMDYLYRKTPPVQHRDLKAANVLLVVEGDGLVAKICDFGSAKWRIALASTSTGNKGSTTAWSAPETYRSKGSPGVFTEASDVWSFGMLVFEIVFLKSPYQGYGDPDILNAVLILKELPYDEDALPSACPTALLEAMKACLDFAPAARPRFSKLAQDLGSSGTAAAALSEEITTVPAVAKLIVT